MAYTTMICSKLIYTRMLIGRLHHCKFFSSYPNNGSDKDFCIHWLNTLHPRKINRSDFNITYARASGAGGQHVNKVSTKATVKMSPETWNKVDWIPALAKEQLTLGKFPYITKSGAIVIQSDRTRSRQDNVEDCFHKLCEAIKNTVYLQQDPSLDAQEKWSGIAKKSNERRLEDKKFHKTKKSARKLSRNDY